MVKLSIIIPYYKTLELTKELMKILKPQLTKEVEVIIIDDGCDEIQLDDFVDDNITIIHIGNKGVSNARNVGIDNAQGQYIAFIDSDDKITPNYIEKILNKICEHFDYCFMSWKATGKLQGEYIIKDIPPDWNTSVWNCIYKKEAIGNNRFDTTKAIAEDEDFNKRVRKGQKANIEDILYIYNSGREDSLTDKFCKGIITQEEPIRAQIIIHQQEVGPIGGIETFLYEFFKALKDDYDILFVYKEIDLAQLRRYRKLVKCIRFENQKFICNKYINCRVLGNIADNVTSLGDYYGQMIHADFEAMGWRYTKHPKTTHHVAVSELAKVSFLKQQPNEKCNVIYNLIDIPKTNKVLNLVSATRLSREKGYNRMKALARELQRQNVKFIWQVFTTDLPNEEIDGFVFRKASFEVRDYIANADYLIQLSDTESWCYAIAEALELKIPVVVTDMPILAELEINENNGIILNKDLSNISEVVKKMEEQKVKKAKSTKKDSKKQWVNELGEMDKQENYKYDEKETVLLKALKKFQDRETLVYYEANKVYEFSPERAEELLNNPNNLVMKV